MLDGYRPCCCRFMLDQGCKTTTTDDGKISYTWNQNEGEPVVPISDKPKIVALSKYMNMSKRGYPHLKVRRLVKDTSGEVTILQCLTNILQCITIR